MKKYAAPLLLLLALALAGSAPVRGADAIDTEPEDEWLLEEPGDDDCNDLEELEDIEDLDEDFGSAEDMPDDARDDFGQWEDWELED